MQSCQMKSKSPADAEITKMVSAEKVHPWARVTMPPATKPPGNMSGPGDAIMVVSSTRTPMSVSSSDLPGISQFD